MIKKFRIQGTHLDKEVLQQQLLDTASAIMKTAANTKAVSEADLDGEWECTQDVITGVPGKYQGRMVFSFRESVR
jgi:hypothetical protein